MKAINCTQCGATIENVSERSVIINCDYCGARIMMDAKPPTRVATVDQPPVYESVELSNPTLKVIATIVGAVFLIPLLIGLVGLFNRPKPTTPTKVYSAPSSPSTYSTPSWMVPNAEPAKPMPVVNYQPRLSWDGPNDLEHFESPEVDISSVSHLTSEEVKKTVFKNRIVKLRVIINTEGEIDTVETISGHPILVEAATESAKRSIFASRSKPTTRVLTFTFRVLKD